MIRVFREFLTVCIVIGCGALALAGPAASRTLEVGPQRDLKNPSDAAKIAAQDDRIAIDPGEYFDCALWRANGITIEAADPENAARVVLTDRACAGKASFVISGNDVTLRGLTFTRMRVPDGNGAGIRAEGRNLTVEHCAFVNNQMGILAANQPSGSLTIRDSLFTDNGACTDHGCVGALGIGALARLRVERSSFRDPRGSQPGDGEPAAGAQITSAAQISELVDNHIEDGDGASSFLVTYLADGALLLTGNTLEKGPRTANSRAAVLVTGTGWGDAESLVLRDNTLINHAGRSGVFLLNWTRVRPELDRNVVAASDTEVSRKGIWRHRLRHGLDELIAAKDFVRHIGGILVRGVRSLV